MVLSRGFSKSLRNGFHKTITKTCPRDMAVLVMCCLIDEEK